MTELDAAVYTIAGQDVTMPVEVRDASAGTAMFEVPLDAAQALLPATAFTVVETSPGVAQLNLATIDYRDNDLGDYHEVGVTLFVRPAGGGDEGTFILRLPVDQEFTCEAGRTIWGFPKSVESITVDYSSESVTTTLSMDGTLVLRLTLPRGGADELPQIPMTTYTLIDGQPHATPFSQGGAGSQVVVGGEGVVVELGSHPIATQLQSLGLPDAPVVLSTWTEHMTGTFGAPVPL